MKRDQVIRILSERRNEIYENFQVKSLALFGSVARDEARSDSDVDLLVEFSSSIGLFEFIRFKQYLESLLGNPVDLGTVDSLKPSLKENVMSEAINIDFGNCS